MSTIKYTETVTYCEIEPLGIVLKARRSGHQFLPKHMRVTHMHFTNGHTTLLVEVWRLTCSAAWSSEQDGSLYFPARNLSEMPDTIRDLVLTEVPAAAEFFTDLEGNL